MQTGHETYPSTLVSEVRNCSIAGEIPVLGGRNRCNLVFFWFSLVLSRP